MVKYFIHKAESGFWDILARGDIEGLKKLKGYLIENSTFGYPIVVVDTCNNKKDAEKYLEDLSEEKKSNT